MTPTDVKITGEKADEAFNQLQSAVQSSLNLSKDENGNVTYTRNIDSKTGNAVELSADAQKLVNAIDDHSITVNVNAVADPILPSGNFILGGGFAGSQVIQHDDLNLVDTYQEVDPNMLGTMDSYYDKNGAGMLHEVTESYLAGKTSQESGVSAGPGKADDPVFMNAHNNAVPQAGPIFERLYDRFGRATLDRDLAVKSEFILRKEGKSEKLIYILQ